MYPIHNCLFGAVKVARNTKNTWSHNDGTLGRNVIIFGVCNLASYFTENGKNDFLIVESGPAQFVEDRNYFLNYLRKSKF